MSSDDPEDDWFGVSLEDDELFANAAGQIADAAQQSISQPNGLRNAFHNTFNSIKMFALSASIKTASTAEQSKAISEVGDVIAQCFGQLDTAQNAALSVGYFTKLLTSDPGCASNQIALQNITNRLSLHSTSPDEFLQPHDELKTRRSAKKFELEEYPELVTTALHDTFYRSAYLPCTCPGKGGTVCLSEEFVCALRLDGYQNVPGDDSHWFFDSIIAGKDDENHYWTPVQFRLPRGSRKQVRVSLPKDSRDVKIKSLSHTPSIIPLDDFCEILKLGVRCFPIQVTKSFKTHRFSWKKDKFFSEVFPEQGAPVLLSTAFKHGNLSAKHKVFLAFAISKAFWQYYASEWMNVEWSLETIQIVRTNSSESEAPFLNIRSAKSRDSKNREPESVTGPDVVRHAHRYPYILNLGLLLFHLGSLTPDATSITTSTTHLTGADKNNRLCISCCKEISAGNTWPTIEIPAKQKLIYRRIVESCFPIRSVSKPLFQEHLDIAGRRFALKEHVVRPLFELFQDMADPKETGLQPPVLQAKDGTKSTPKTPSDLAWDWLDNVTQSPLYQYVFCNIEDAKRPKIAIIDTGFDSKAGFINHRLKKRLNMLSAIGKCNWKDFWQSGTVPQDDDGHGTAMLSIIDRIAPFANLCVARIAGQDGDLKEHPEITSNNLAKAIIWAAEEQKADIVSLSLGWEQEHRVDQKKNRAISNGILSAISHRNQHLLIFAAASNLGGSKCELFPASHSTVFSIRGTNTQGKHEEFNPSLPKGGKKVFGTLGLEVPVSSRGKLAPQHYTMTGTSVATAIAAGLAAMIIGYINIRDQKGSWDNIRTFEGFEKLLHMLSTEPEGRKRFITLDNHSELRSFETDLSMASK